MNLSTKYDPKGIETRLYEYWTSHKLFASRPDAREPFTIIIPPPNVTGILHMGHMLNNTIQDILVRKARLEGKNACWVPGTDHASIATEAKVVSRLAEQGIRKRDLTREQFLTYAWDWTREHGGIILQQLRRLGTSCDWDRTAFTMDAKRSQSVEKVFCDLYEKGLIYRGLRMVNWDPKAQTVLSTEEVVYRTEQSKLYYLRYYVADTDVNPIVPAGVEGEKIYRNDRGYYAVVATTRPETIMGDTAMCINPKDPKNGWLRGHKVVVPLVGRVVPVIEDRYVDIDFGTGCLKVTPAHDINDYNLGKAHHLDTIDIFNPDGTLSEAAGLYVGEDRMDVRKRIVEDLRDAGLLEKEEDYENSVGYSERNPDTAVEPRLCKQWFLSMRHFADIALPPVLDGRIKFYPSKYVTTYRNWLENIQDWCISRQLWWGHRIPAYFLPQRESEEEERYVVALSIDEAVEKARRIKGYEDVEAGDLRRDEDALDTWFSSWLWPLSLFDAINHPGNEEINYYYPTSVLVTGPDIIFFWVARMIMAGEEYIGDVPFRNVYFTGIVRDNLGRKMSKQLGNSPDPIGLIDKYGADGVRMGMLLSAPAGNDILFKEELCRQGAAFCNKIWNAFRLVKGWDAADLEQSPSDKKTCRWFEAKLREAHAEIEEMYGRYRLNEALMAAFKLFTDEFSGWFLEMIKPAYGQPVSKQTLEATLAFFEKLMQIIHPFMPFITEELYQHIAERADGESIMISRLDIPAPAEADKRLIAQYEEGKQIISGVRAVRQSKNIAPREPLILEVVMQNTEDRNVTKCPAFGPVIKKMAGLKEVHYVTAKGDGTSAFLVGTTEYAVVTGALADVEAETEKIKAQLAHLESFLAGIQKKLSNERFTQNAKPEIVALERKKQADTEEKIAALRESLAALRGGE
ncbi:MAG: valine--tRNA ligase [Prevotella sp.]|nr:valine--tRNA ligase [Prevotella sp.]